MPFRKRWRKIGAKASPFYLLKANYVEVLLCIDIGKKQFVLMTILVKIDFKVLGLYMNLVSNSLFDSFQRVTDFLIFNLNHIHNFFYSYLNKTNYSPLILKINHVFFTQKNHCFFFMQKDWSESSFKETMIEGEVEKVWTIFKPFYSWYKSQTYRPMTLVLPEKKQINIWVKKECVHHFEQAKLVKRVAIKLKNHNIEQTEIEKTAQKISSLMMKNKQKTVEYKEKLDSNGRLKKGYITVLRGRKMVLHSTQKKDKIGEGAYKTVFRSHAWEMGSNANDDKESHVADQRIIGTKDIRVCLKEDDNLALLKKKLKSQNLVDPSISRFIFKKDGKERLVITTTLYQCDLEKRLNDTNSSLSIDQKLLFLKQIIDALRFLHNEGKVHCDVKPCNIFIKRDENGKERCYLADIGQMENRGSQGRFYGTRGYKPPEVLGKFLVIREAQADIYALGVTAYHMFSSTSCSVPDDESERFKEKEWDHHDPVITEIQEKVIKPCLQFNPKDRISLNQLEERVDAIRRSILLQNSQELSA